MRFLRTVICALALPAAAFGVPRPDSLQHDTTTEQRIQILDPGISTGHSELLFPSSLARDRLIIVPLIPTTSLLRTGSPLPFLTPGSAGKLDLLLPLREQLSAQTGFQSIRIVLGTAELAGVAYIMYRHVKKYGLFK